MGYLTGFGKGNRPGPRYYRFRQFFRDFTRFFYNLVIGRFWFV
jgi:hypothetical protein